MKKILLTLSATAFLLAGCEKESAHVVPQKLEAQRRTADASAAFQQGYDRGVSDARYIAAGYSDCGGVPGGGNPYTPTNNNGGTSGGDPFTDPNNPNNPNNPSNQPITYTHTYCYTPQNQVAFERDYQYAKSQGESNYNAALASGNTFEIDYWEGFLQGMDAYQV